LEDADLEGVVSLITEVVSKKGDIEKFFSSPLFTR